MLNLKGRVYSSCNGTASGLYSALADCGSCAHPRRVEVWACWRQTKARHQGIVVGSSMYGFVAMMLHIY
jgi:hypothetical protein